MLDESKEELEKSNDEQLGDSDQSLPYLDAAMGRIRTNVMAI
jgi:hypothetical protein